MKSYTAPTGNMMSWVTQIIQISNLSAPKDLDHDAETDYLSDMRKFHSEKFPRAVGIPQHSFYFSRIFHRRSEPRLGSCWVKKIEPTFI